MARPTTRLHRLARHVFQVWGRQYLAHVQALAPLHTFVAARTHDAHHPDYADLAYLWRQVVTRQPRRVLEYGSGCSTLILALALQRTGRPGDFLSLETDPVWAEQTLKALPSTVRHWCQVVVSPLVAAISGDVRGFAYAAQPHELVPDLIYLDGPGFTVAHAALQTYYAVDLLDLEPRLRVGCRLVIDGRAAQTAFLRQHLQRPWRYRRDQVMDRQVLTLGEAKKEVPS